jgi:divalent metal cation (Fe/Co/Zn/Cd) transporter
VAALFASAVIAFNGIRLLSGAVREVMDAAPPAHLEERIRRAALGVRGVAGLDKCYVRKMGLEYFVDLHVIVDGNMSVRRGHEIAHEVKNAVRKTEPKVTDVLVHIEPDRAGADHKSGQLTTPSQSTKAR